MASVEFIKWKNFLCIDQKPNALQQFLKAATKLKRELLTDVEIESVPIMEISCLAEDICVKTWKASLILILIWENF